MSSKNVHRLHGFALAATITYFGYSQQNPIPYLVCAAGAMAGFSAPDWMEISWWAFGKRRCIIPHRTVTHVVSLWVCGLLVGIQKTGDWGNAAYFLIGFSVSALIHLAFDYSTSMGVPLWPWAPGRRISSRNKNVRTQS